MAAAEYPDSLPDVFHHHPIIWPDAVTKIPVNWNDKDVFERLFIATLASLDNKMNIHEVARLYGKDMTYHALENRMRKYKKEATALKDESAGREGPAKTRAKTDAGPAKGAVITGWITKNKAPATTRIKFEPLIKEDALDGEAASDDGAGGEVDEFV
ncbi:hypothetical protein G6011_01218 [Alternaria panax]|uniref:Uncharacterized protein n=1 Tax=Alternaria panax TaxID=48097 RepID=A0AAD4IK92_9PLEO|nr:hypothetical protein G6011_01218 [Alternaria panax]